MSPNEQAYSPRALECVEHVLRSMEISSVATLQTKEFQVAVVQAGMIWAYFPIDNHQQIVRDHHIDVQPGAKVLLVIGEDSVAINPETTTYSELAHHFGHVLCYLRKPDWIHDCLDADRAARECGLATFLDPSRTS